MNGEDHARRKYLFYYSGKHLGAVRKRNFKMAITAGHGGMPVGKTFDIIDDPREEHPHYIYGMRIVSEHMKLINQFPNRELLPSPGASLFEHD